MRLLIIVTYGENLGSINSAETVPWPAFSESRSLEDCLTVGRAVKKFTVGTVDREETLFGEI
jgi:hypothetical protein